MPTSTSVRQPGARSVYHGEQRPRVEKTITVAAAENMTEVTTDDVIIDMILPADSDAFLRRISFVWRPALEEDDAADVQATAYQSAMATGIRVRREKPARRFRRHRDACSKFIEARRLSFARTAVATSLCHAVHHFRGDASGRRDGRAAGRFYSLLVLRKAAPLRARCWYRFRYRPTGSAIMLCSCRLTGSARRRRAAALPWHGYVAIIDDEAPTEAAADGSPREQQVPPLWPKGERGDDASQPAVAGTTRWFQQGVPEATTA